ncbi:sensor protein divL [Antarctobacter heliothermus]|uniref:histidine kinase n=1 Tax=Antarctobacter heliothermus TaxID=74033 RepID=A0A222E098_9RHOB|nr:PAS-domain containing protein [Antarctobacter heliothermus]ASP19634.1 sensor protein divL [Antarctobacter heliothermus]
MTHYLIDPKDPVERQNEKLLRISEALMRRVEQDTDQTGAAYAQFERAAMLEDQVRQRTRDLEYTLDLLNQSNAALARAKHEAEHARKNLANAIEAVQEGFGLFDSNDRLVMWNSRFTLPLHDVQPCLSEGLPFNDYVTAISESRFLQLPNLVTPAQWAEQRLKRHKDLHAIFNVSLIWDRWLQVSEHRTPDGGTVVLQTDVTDIMRLERQERGKLLDSQARMLRATLDHLNQGVCIFDANARLVGWNDRIGEMLTVPVVSLRLGVDFDRLVDLLEPRFVSDVVSSRGLRDWAHQDRDRRPLRFEIRAEPDTTLDVFAQEMPDRGFVISFTDVSVERQATRALAEANELLERRVMERTLELEDALVTAERANSSKSRFVAAASHDLLQPLSAAKLYVAAVSESGESGETVQAAEKALSALGSVENIIDALLDISKLDSGAASLDITAVSVRQLLTALRDEFAPMAALKGLDLRVVPTTGSVASDPGFLRRILQNLIANAIRYTTTGRVLVGTRRQGSSLRFEVWDTGPGIAEADQERIFREFERLDRNSSVNEGLGLGLAIVERACDQLRHPLGVQSTVGQGTRFFFSAQRVNGPEEVPILKRSPAARQRLRDSGLIVLLVENDNELRRALSLLIERWGGSVLDASNAEEADALLNDLGILPDALLVDYNLGDGKQDGLSLVRQLRARDARLPARLMSANRSNELHLLCDAAQVGLMTKPINTEDLESFLFAATRGVDLT